ncbi:ROK family protein [Plantactinospora endophytica]|uniref:Transcriptional regulator n=1 Tax=Plantactinospora endophytica TaxID=673535 RepID=A0ABQ4EAT5_9ACTN|nr:ROK family protein [Plantactinospora endophytica]GIG91824.1 transcriptional regulator [Plantactinospora endophytica]
MAQPAAVPVGAAVTAVRQASLREHNLALVLRQIATADRPPSRADLATATGLTRATVSALVDDLITGRLLTEVAPAPRSGAGRPAVGLTLADHGPAGLGLEINVDYLAAVLVDLTGTVRHRAVRRVDLRPVPPAEALSLVGELISEAGAEADRQDLTLAGTALAVPGLVTATGLVRLAPNLGWRDVDVPALLGAHPILGGRGLGVDNEANLAALGELHAAPPGSANFVYISGEVGIGAGIVLHGTLFRGARGWSGEIGHVPVHPEGRPCRCGGRGCLEQYAGQEAILAAAGLTDPPSARAPSTGRPARRHGPNGPLRVDGDRADDGSAARGIPVPGAAIARLAEAAARDDPAACRALVDAATALGVAVAGVINLLDVDTVVLGGVYAPLARWLAPTVRAEIGRRVLTAAWSPVTVRAALLGGDAAALGAAGSVVRTVLEQPARWLGRTAR